MCGQFSLQEGFTSIWDRWADLEISAENLVHYVKCNMTANVLNQQSLARVESELRLQGYPLVRTMVVRTILDVRTKF